MINSFISIEEKRDNLLGNQSVAISSPEYKVISNFCKVLGTWLCSFLIPYSMFDFVLIIDIENKVGNFYQSLFWEELNYYMRKERELDMMT